MLSAAKVARSYWTEALTTAVHVRNLSPTMVLQDKVPETVWSGRVPSVAHLRVFGCLVFLKVLGPREKTAPKAKKCVFLGYEQSGRVYRVMDMSTQKVLRAAAQDLHFVEDTPATQDRGDVQAHLLFAPDEDGEGEGVGSTLPGVAVSVGVGGGVGPPALPALPHVIRSAEWQPHVRVEGLQSRGDAGPMGQPTALLGRSIRLAQKDTTSEEQSQPSHSMPKEIEENADMEEGLDFPGIDVGPQSERPFADFLYFIGEVLTEAPQLYNAAVTSPERGLWLQAIQKERDSLLENGTWEVADLPKGAKALETKWVFVVKRLADGTVERYKARLVAKGYQQEYGINYDAIFAPVAKLATIRGVIAVVTVLDWELEQMDVVTAFLNGELGDEEIYIKQPEGLEIPGQESKVLRLRKALYGLKQAPRLWNKALDAYLKEIGFVPCFSDHALYVLLEDGNPVMFIAVYVDDLLLACKDQAMMSRVKGELSSKFAMKDLGPVTYYLGIEVMRDRAKRVTELSQEAYISKVVQRFNLEGAKPAIVPMDPKMKWEDSKEQTQAEDMARVPYASAVGAVLYAVMCTRPDICFAISQLSRFSSKPRREHWEALKDLIKYLKGTAKWHLTYTGEKGLTLESFTDANFSMCKETDRSITGQVLMLAGGVVEWRSKKQGLVTMSTCEAEYVAMTETCKSILWHRQLLQELGVPQTKSTVLHCDSLSAVRVAYDPVHHDRTKHIRCRYHFIRECVANKEVHVQHRPGDINWADLLTKPVERPRLVKLARGMGLHA
jgi:hypothetical protein